MGITLVTGGSGFIGSLLARRLFQDGRSVRVFDIIDFPHRDTRIQYEQGDIRNREDIEKALEGVDVVYHNVALVPLAKAGRKFWDVNVTGTDLLLQACRKRAIHHFVHVSSSAVFGTPQCPITHETPLRPVEVYGRAKLAGERLVAHYLSEGHAAAIIRPRTVLGNFRLGIFHILFEWVSEGRAVYLIGKGDNFFQFIHVDDLIEAMIRTEEKKVTGVLNIGTDQFGTLREDLGSFIKEVGSSSGIRSLPASIVIPGLRVLDFLRLSPLAPWHYLTYHKPFYFDVSHEMQILDWKPKYSNVQMLVSSYRWYLENRDRLRMEKDGHSSTHHTAPKQRLLKIIKWFS